MYSFAEFLNWCSLFASTFVLLWYYSTSTFDHWKKLRIEFKKPVPVFGNLAKCIFRGQTLHELLDVLYAYFGANQFGGMFIVRKPWLVIKGPELVHTILVTDFHYFPERFTDFFYPHKTLNPLSTNVSFSSHNRWRYLRKKMNPIFALNKLRQLHSSCSSMCVISFMD